LGVTLLLLGFFVALNNSPQRVEPDNPKTVGTLSEKGGATLVWVVGVVPGVVMTQLSVV